VSATYKCHLKCRITISLSVSIFLFSLLSSLAISATPTNVEVVRSIEEAEVVPGDELKVSLNISASSDVMALLLTEKLPQGFIIATSNPTFTKYNSTTGEVAWLFHSSTGLGNMTITYTVDVSTNVSEGVYNIEGYWSAVNSDASIIHGESYFTEVQVKKLTSTLSLSVSPSKAKIGENITLTGSIFPTLPNVNVTLSYVKPNGFVFKRNVTVYSEGEFMDTYKWM